MLQRLILITMEDYSDSDTSSESGYESSQGSKAESDCDEDELSQDLEPELSETYDEYKDAPWNPAAQLQAQLHAVQLAQLHAVQLAQLYAVQLAQLHADIKAWAELLDPTYKKLSWSWPSRPFDVWILPDYVEHPIHYFELFWGPEVWNILIENTNAYAQYKEARYKENIEGKKSR